MLNKKNFSSDGFKDAIIKYLQNPTTRIMTIDKVKNEKERKFAIKLIIEAGKSINLKINKIDNRSLNTDTLHKFFVIDLPKDI